MSPRERAYPGTKPEKKKALDDPIGDAVDVLHLAYCDGPYDPRCLRLRREVEKAVRRVYETHGPWTGIHAAGPR